MIKDVLVKYSNNLPDVRLDLRNVSEHQRKAKTQISTYYCNKLINIILLLHIHFYYTGWLHETCKNRICSELCNIKTRNILIHILLIIFWLTLRPHTNVCTRWRVSVVDGALWNRTKDNVDPPPSSIQHKTYRWFNEKLKEYHVYQLKLKNNKNKQLTTSKIYQCFLSMFQKAS